MRRFLQVIFSIWVTFVLLLRWVDAPAMTLSVPGSSPTIQGALNAASPGDLILVVPGTYFESIDFLGKDVVLRGTAGPEMTVISAPSTLPVVRFGSGETRAAVLEGFTITGGQIGDPSNPFDTGGGMRIVESSPTVRGNHIQDNVSCTDGAGIRVNGGAPRIEFNLIRRNRIYCGPFISGYLAGGGMSLAFTAAEIVGNVISDNSASVAAAILMNNSGTPLLSGNIITRNVSQGDTCDSGAIVTLNSSSPDLVQNIVTLNTPCAMDFSVSFGTRGPYLLNNTIAQNGATGMRLQGFFDQVRLVNNIIYGQPSSVGVDCDTVFASAPPQIADNDAYATNGTPFTVGCGVTLGTNGNVSVEPRFNSPMASDFRLLIGSPAVDAGSNSAVGLPALDVVGQPRVQDGNGDGIAIVDLGALEGAIAPQPMLISVSSRRAHGSVGDFDLSLSAVATNPTTEPRRGPLHTIVFTFDRPIAGATTSVTEGVANAATPTFIGNDIVVGLSGVSDAQYVTVSLTNVASLDGGAGGSGLVRLGFLRGDVSQSRVVTVADLGLVNAQLSQIVTAANYLKDVNTSGTLTLADKAISSANLTKALPAP